jgi:hypothetical protein
LLDFPIPAATLAEHATRIKIHGHVFHIASDEDLLRLKKIAKAARSSPGDAEDSLSRSSPEELPVIVGQRVKHSGVRTVSGTKTNCGIYGTILPCDAWYWPEHSERLLPKRFLRVAPA